MLCIVEMTCVYTNHGLHTYYGFVDKVKKKIKTVHLNNPVHAHLLLLEMTKYSQLRENSRNISKLTLPPRHESANPSTVQVKQSLMTIARMINSHITSS